MPGDIRWIPAVSQMTRPIWAPNKTIRTIGLSVMSVRSESLAPMAPAHAAVTSRPPNIHRNTRWRNSCGPASSACRAAYSILEAFSLDSSRPAREEHSPIGDRASTGPRGRSTARSPIGRAPDHGYHRPVDRLSGNLSEAYDKGIQAPGKEIHFLILIAFLLSFGF